MMKQLIIFIAIMCLIPAGAMAKKKKENKAKEVSSAKIYVPAKEMYVYGVVYSLTDSVAYLTDVMQVADAYKQKKTKFLYARNEYSAQLEKYMKSANVDRPTVITMFDEKRAALEKKYTKMKARLQKDGYLVKNVTAVDFQYKGVPYE